MVGSVISTAHSEDEWPLEALANYSSLLWLEKKRGVKEMDAVLNGYRSSCRKRTRKAKLMNRLA
jgi:succinate dehydrogenase flavin-adding protein (antitoxin of CptAB toxin-antitoxin module)